MVTWSEPSKRSTAAKRLITLGKLSGSGSVLGYSDLLNERPLCPPLSLSLSISLYPHPPPHLPLVVCSSSSL